MAQLRAKQIKLAAAGDLLIGGTGGTGATLTKGADTTVLKVVSGGLQYANVLASETTFTPGSGVAATTVQAAIEEVAGDVTTLSGTVDGKADASAVTAVVERVDDLNTALGVTGDAYTTVTGTYYLNSTTSFREADLALDTAAKAALTEAQGARSDAAGAQNSANDALADIGDMAFNTGGVIDGDLTITAALNSLDTAVSALEGSTLGTEVNAIETAVGLASDGTKTDFANAGHYSASGSFKAAIEGLDSALTTAEGNISTLQGQVSGLAGLGALHFVGFVEGGATDTVVGEGETFETQFINGNVYRIQTTGSTDWAGTGLEVNVGDYVVVIDAAANSGAGEWVKFDNTDPTVAGTADRITVTGDAHQGYTVDVASTYVGQASITTVGTIGTGTWNATAISLAKGGTGADLSSIAAGGLIVGNGAGSVGILAHGSTGQFLTWNGSAIAWADIPVAITHVEEDFVGVASGAGAGEFDAPGAGLNLTIALGNDPIDEAGLAVFVNGLKLPKSTYSLTVDEVTIDVSAVGYDMEAGDVVSVSYNYTA